jgi:hypothetical protein
VPQKAGTIDYCVSSVTTAPLLLSLAAVVSADQALFVMRERLTTWSEQPCPTGTLGRNLSYTELRVVEDGTAEVRTWRVPACTNPPRDWTRAPGSKRRTLRISRADYDRFRELLAGPNVQRLTSFHNAGPGVGDYELQIARVSGTQRISIVSLMPEHDELRRDPTLLRLICEAKHFALRPEPQWCAPATRQRED